MAPHEIFALMLVGHAIADYPLQGDFLARAKNRTAPIPGVPWQQAMAAHAIIHGGFVGVITGSVGAGFAEAVCHWLIDDLKCCKQINYNTDQALHVGCKILWTMIWIIGAASA